MAVNSEKCLLVACVLLLCIAQCLARPLNNCEQERCNAKLTKYWKDVGMGNITADIKNMQRNFNLTESGEIDNETCQYILNMMRWDRKIITWRIVQKNFSTRMNKTLENSLNKWSNSTDLEFVYVNSSNADIQIKFENINECKEGGLVLNSTKVSMFACVYPPGDDKGGDVYFNPGFPWGNHTITYYKDLNLSQASFYAFGYALGLDRKINQLEINVRKSSKDGFFKQVCALYKNPSDNKCDDFTL